MDPHDRLHESYHSHGEVKASSDRMFGIILGVVFMILGGYMIFNSSIGGAIVLFAVGCVFLFTSFVAPKILSPLNKVWTKFGLLLHSIVNPVIMSILFFLIFTPFGLVMRAFVWDGLNRKFDHKATSYWIDRKQDSTHGSMKEQF